MCKTCTLPAPAARTITVQTRRGPKIVESSFTDREAIDSLRGSDSTFAADLIRQHDASRRPLSVVQMAWIHVLAVEAQPSQPTAPPAVQTPPVAAQTAEMVTDDDGMVKIVAMFKKAGSTLKAPKIRLQDGSGRTYQLRLAGPYQRYPGTVNVTTGRGSVWLGRIMEDGLFLPTRHDPLPDGLVDLLAAFAADPASVARKYGGLTGRCCFCGLTLTDPRSTTAGYGPVCAVNYSLPY